MDTKPAVIIPKAITLASFVRLFISTVFIHGMGGARYEKIDEGGSVIEIVRDGESLDIIIQHLDIDYLSDDYYFDEYNQNDSVYFDTIPPDTSKY